MKIQKSLRHESHQIKEFEQLYAFSYTIVQEIHIFRLEQQRWSLESVISFSKVCIWDLGLANSNCNHVIQISIRRWKVTIFSDFVKSVNIVSLNAWNGGAMPSTALFGVAMPSHVRLLGGDDDLALHRPATQLQVNTRPLHCKKGREFV